MFSPPPEPSPAERLLALASDPGCEPERIAALLAREPRLARALVIAAGALGSSGRAFASLDAARRALSAEDLRDVALAVALALVERERAQVGPRRSDAALAAAFARSIAPLVGADATAAVSACAFQATGAPRAVELARDFARELAAWAKGPGSLPPPRDSAVAAALGLSALDVERLLLLRSRALQLARCAAA